LNLTRTEDKNKNISTIDDEKKSNYAEDGMNFLIPNASFYNSYERRTSKTRQTKIKRQSDSLRTDGIKRSRAHF
jgi:hypothetical protein